MSLLPESNTAEQPLPEQAAGLPVQPNGGQADLLHLLTKTGLHAQVKNHRINNS